MAFGGGVWVSGGRFVTYLVGIVSEHPFFG